MYDAYQQRIVECDQHLEQHLKGFADKVTDTAANGEPSLTPPQRDCVRVPSAVGKPAVMPRSLMWAVNCIASPRRSDPHRWHRCRRGTNSHQ